MTTTKDGRSVACLPTFISLLILAVVLMGIGAGFVWFVVRVLMGIR